MNYKVWNFLRDYNHISISDLDDILETLQDHNFLSEDGKKFKNRLWRLYIREEEK